MVPMKFLTYCLIHGSFSLLIGYPNSVASTQSLLCFVTSLGLLQTRSHRRKVTLCYRD